MTGEEQPKYRQIADDLYTRIGRGEYIPGGRLPSKAALMKQYGVAVGTVDAAIRQLRKLGVAETKQGVGTFVLKAEADKPVPVDEQLAAEVAELRTRVQEMNGDLGRVEGNLADLYVLTGNEYPSENLPATADEKDSRREQRA